MKQPGQLRTPQVGDTWAYRGTHHKGSQIEITRVSYGEVSYVHERRATTKLRLFHKRFDFVRTKAEQDAMMRRASERWQQRDNR